jgi:hypothetical protein
MRWGQLQRQELYAKQYHIRLEALLRQSGDDVTAQIVSAFRTVIKTKLKDYIPNKESLLDAAVKVFAESMKLLSRPWGEIIGHIERPRPKSRRRRDETT